VQGLTVLLAAVAFIAGVSGLVFRLGRQDEGTTWYPWPTEGTANTLLVVAAGAAGLALVGWVFAVLT
jgi:hypothetical protein